MSEIDKDPLTQNPQADESIVPSPETPQKSQPCCQSPDGWLMAMTALFGLMALIWLPVFQNDSGGATRSAQLERYEREHQIEIAASQEKDRAVGRTTESDH